MVGVFHASTITTVIPGTLGMTDAIFNRFDTRDEVRTMEKGKFEIVRIGRMTIGSYFMESDLHGNCNQEIPGVAPPGVRSALKRVSTFDGRQRFIE